MEQRTSKRIDRNTVMVVCAVVAMIGTGVALFSLMRDDGAGPSAREGIAERRQPPDSGGQAGGPAVPVEAAAPADYFPLSDTYRRNYLVEVSGKDEETQFGIATVTVEGRETIRGEEYYKVLLRVSGIAEMNEPVVRYARKSGDAWRELDGARKSDAAFEVVMLPLPPKAGATWDKDTPVERSNWKVEGSEKVVLFGKEYANSLRMAYERRLKEEAEYFETGHYLLAPGVGLIKQVAFIGGTRITYTLDDRSPDAIAFYTTWAGAYKEVTRGMTVGSMRLSANGRYAITSVKADSAVDEGECKLQHGREGEVLFVRDDGKSVTYRLRKSRAGSDRVLLHLKSVEADPLLDLEYVREVSDR